MNESGTDPPVDPLADSLVAGLAANASLRKFIGERRPTADELIEDLLANYRLEE